MQSIAVERTHQRPQDGSGQQALSERLYAQGLGFCATDLSLTMSMLDEADEALDPFARMGSLARARRAMERVLEVLPHLHLAYEERRELCAWVEAVGARLQAADHQAGTLGLDLRRMGATHRGNPF